MSLSQQNFPGVLYWQPGPLFSAFPYAPLVFPFPAFFFVPIAVTAI